MRNNKLLVIGAVSFLFIVVLLLIIFNASRKGGVNRLQLAATPTIASKTPTSVSGILSVLATDPADASDNTPLDKQIVITFNREFSKNELNIEFLDNSLQPVAHTYTITASRLILKPTAPLNQATVYTIRVRDRYIKTIKEFSFLTLTVAPSPDTRPIPALTETIIRTRAERPDVYLANELPYESFDFKMVLEIDNEGYFTFVVTSNRLTGELLKDSVQQWLLNLELTKAQIETLKIVYR